MFVEWACSDALFLSQSEHAGAWSFPQDTRLVGWRGFEPPTSRPRTARATKLRHHP